MERIFLLRIKEEASYLLFRLLVLVLGLLIGSYHTVAQEDVTPQWSWAKAPSGTESKGISTQSNGDSYVLSALGNHFVITRYDSTGSMLWERTGSSGTGTVIAGDITSDAAGNYYVTGRATNTVSIGSSSITFDTYGDLFIVKYDAAGSTVWAQKYTTAYIDQGSSIAVDDQGNCYVSGGSSVGPISTTSTHYLVAKYNSSGVLQWSRTSRGTGSYTTASYPNANAISVDGFGNSYLTGFCNTPGGINQFFISKYDPSGYQVWIRTGGEARGMDITVDEVGNSYVTGLFSATASFGSISLTSIGTQDIFIAKYNAAGQCEWARGAGGPDYDHGGGIAIDAIGNSYVTGRFQSIATFSDITISNFNSGAADIFVAKISPEGIPLWVQQAGVSGTDFGSSIGVDANGNTYTAGYFTSAISFGETDLSSSSTGSFIARLGKNRPAKHIINTKGLAQQTLNAGASIEVSFTSEGEFDANNLFQVELSHPFGSFTFPAIIGEGKTSPLHAVIPATAIIGKAYRVRVVATHPRVSGVDNGSDISINGYSQQQSLPQWSWAKAPSGTESKGISTQSNGDSYVLSALGNHFVITRYDSTGSMLWERTGSSGTGTVIAGDITSDAAGNYYVTGRATNTVSIGSSSITFDTYGDLFIVKYDAAGSTVWAQKYTTAYIDQGSSIAVDDQGNCYVSGGSSVGPISTTSTHYLVAKYNSSGVLQWSRTSRGTGSYTTASYPNANAISVDGFGNSYLTGFCNTPGGINQFFISKYDPSGYQVWIRTGGEARGMDITVDEVGNSYVTGLFSATASFGSISLTSIGTQDIFIAKYNAAGQCEWARGAGGPDYDHGGGIAIDAIGNSYVTGRFQSIATFSDITISNFNSGAADIFVAKISPEGIPLWVQQAGVSGIDYTEGIGLDANGNTYVSGVFTNAISFGETDLTSSGQSAFIARLAGNKPTTVGKPVVFAGNICGASSVRVIFPITGKFNSENEFILQLSDGSGSFEQAMNVGAKSGVVASDFFITLPADLPTGTGYRFRVVSTSPSRVGVNNDVDIEINREGCNVFEAAEVPPLIAAEYYFDEDPGVGNGVFLASFDNLADVSVVNSIDISSLSPGFHNLFIRVQNTTGTWGLDEGRIFYVQPEANALDTSSIVAVEYFFDTDPGVGKALTLDNTFAVDQLDILGNFSTESLEPGFHDLFLRVQNTHGKWSHAEGRVFYIQPGSFIGDNGPVVAAEYFFNTDPGNGKGLSIASFTEGDIIDLSSQVSLEGLVPGFHNLFIRVKDSVGIWSHAEGRVVYVQPTAVANNGGPIIAAEYFVGTDPGHGKGTPVTSFAPTDFLDINNLIAASGIQEGTHDISFRVRDSVGVWSMKEVRRFIVCGEILDTPQITGAGDVCSGDQVTLSAGTVSGASSYYWIGPNGFTSTEQQFSFTASAANQGTYQVWAVKGSMTCDSSNVAQVDVTYHEKPDLVATDIVACTVDLVNLTNLFVDQSNVEGIVKYYSDEALLNEVITPEDIKESGTYYIEKATSFGCSDVVTVDVAITFCKLDQVITFEPITGKTFGDPAFELIASSDSGLEILFTSSDPSIAQVEGNRVTIVGAGMVTFGAVQTGNETFLEASTVSQTIDIAKANQEIVFDALATRSFDSGAFELTATATSGLPIAYLSSNEAVATVNGTTLTMVGLGTSMITAEQNGNQNYHPALSVGQQLSVQKGSQLIVFDPIADKRYGEGSFELQGVASSGLGITYESSNTQIAEIDGSLVTILGVGQTQITARQSGNGFYDAAPVVAQNLIILKGLQSIEFATLPNRVITDGVFNLNAEASSGVDVIYESSNPAVATIEGNLVTLIGAGSSEITASQAGNDFYEPAADIIRTLVVQKAPQFITFNALSSRLTTDLPFSLNGTASSGLTVLYESSNTDVAVINGNIVNILGAGSTEITASQPGDDLYEAAEVVTVILEVFDGLPLSLSNSQALKVYPVPAKTELNVELLGVSKSMPALVRIYSIDGQLLLTQYLIEPRSRVRLSGFSSGLHIMVIQFDGSEIVNRIQIE